jgi:hypothetical protein
MTQSEIFERIDALKPWFHSIDLGDGIRIERDLVHGGDRNYPENLWRKLRTLLPRNFQGLHVLDVGVPSLSSLKAFLNYRLQTNRSGISRI